MSMTGPFTRMSVRQSTFVLSAAAVESLVAQAASATLPPSGSFEAPATNSPITLITNPSLLPGWTFSQTGSTVIPQYGYLYDNPPQASDGDQYIALYSTLSGGVAIRTVTLGPIPVTPNANYQLSFDLRPISNTTDFSSKTEVLINGLVEATYLYAANPPVSWTSHTLLFDVPVSSAQVAFRVSANGALVGDGQYFGVDNVSVTSVSEPNALALLGVAGLGTVTPRRRPAAASAGCSTRSGCSG